MFTGFCLSSGLGDPAIGELPEEHVRGNFPICDRIGHSEREVDGLNHWKNQERGNENSNKL